MSKKRKFIKKLPKKYVFITFRIRIVTIILKKIFGESNFKSNFLGFDSEKFQICMFFFLENVKNGFELILWQKKCGGGGGLIRKGVLYAGFYGIQGLSL